MMNCHIKVTKKLYKLFDSYERRQKWILKEFVKNMKEQYGLEKTDSKRIQKL